MPNQASSDQASRWPQEFSIGNRVIGAGHPVYFIAEAGVNNNGSLDLAKQLVDVAVEAQADAVKFQTFRPELLNTRTAPKAEYHLAGSGTDEAQSWFELLETQVLTPAMHDELIAYCGIKGIQFLSTPYDEVSLALLDKLDMPVIKVASTDANNIPLLIQIARTGRPVIIANLAAQNSREKGSDFPPKAPPKTG